MSSSSLVDVAWGRRRVRIEHRCIAPERRSAPLLVFLHEGLGSLSMWKQFPETLCDELGWRGLVYSRPGYGRSSPRGRDERWGLDFMHQQAQQVLPALLAALDIDTEADPPWLFGHSDGGSIALLHAAAFPARVSGLVVLAPHVFVEDLTTHNIQQARAAYRDGDLRQRLARYHDDPDSAFWGWNDVWLHPDFPRWNIEAEIEPVACPVLAIQGVDDEYGTLEQVERIAQRLPGTQVVALPQCGHSPHRDQPDAVVHAVRRFIGQHGPLPADAVPHRPHPQGDTPR